MKRLAADTAWYRAAARTAGVAGAFGGLALVLLLANFVQSRRWAPIDHPRLVALRAQLERRPTDEALKGEIRRLDRQVREEYFSGKVSARHGSLLLLGSVLVFLASVKVAKQYCKKLPKPAPDAPESAWAAAAPGRQSVAVLGVMAAVGLALLWMPARRDLAFDYAKAVGVSAKRVRAASGYASAEEMARNWPLFRGPGSTGIVVSGKAPTVWDGASGKGILWKAPVPLPGKNSPVVWGDRVFVSGATAQQREVYCFDAASGRLLWKGAVGGAAAPAADAPAIPEDTGYAAPTMAVDGRRALALFATGHLAGFNFEGQLLWMRNLGMPDSMYGHASSLSLWRDRLLVQYDQGAAAEDGKSALLALDAATGATVWEAKRPVPNSWSTPIVVKTEKGEEIVACGNPWVMGYDPATGQERWRAEVLSGDVAPTPVYAGGLVFACNTGSNLAAIRAGGTGNVTESGIAWMAQDGLPDIISPLCDCQLVFLVTSEGMVTCLDATSGSLVWEHDLMKSVRSSPTLVGKRIYLTDQEGVTHFFEATRTFKALGTAALGEPVETTPAFANGRMFVRGEKNLYCIGES